jgi:hypothetical protein
MDPELEEIQQNEEEEFDYTGLILRRADPDDCDQIINLVEVGKDDVYNRVYSYPRILKLIESAYLAITVLDRDGNVVAFAAFEDYPQVSSSSSCFIVADHPTVGHERNARRPALQLLGAVVLLGVQSRGVLGAQHPVAGLLHSGRLHRLPGPEVRVQEDSPDRVHLRPRHHWSDVPAE